MVEFASRVGVWWTTDLYPIGEVRAAAAELEELGYGSLWYGEAYGKEAFTQAGALLGATGRLVVGTGIANIHARDALAAESGARTLTALHPGRAHGDEAAIAARVREHLDAGADHVCVQVLTDEGPAGDPRADLRALAPTLTTLAAA